MMDSFRCDSLDSPPSNRRSESDEETYYATVSSAPPKRRAGRTKFRETRHPVFKGVRRRNGDKWVCEVREPNKKSRIWLGTFPTAEMAARAHDVAAIALRGRAACLNFADSARLLPAPDSSSPADIRRAAACAAEAFRPQQAVAADGPEQMQGGSITEWGNEQPPVVVVAAAEDAFFAEDGLDLGMQGYVDMAEGLLIDPPPLPPVNDEDYEDVLLWSYSV